MVDGDGVCLVLIEVDFELVNVVFLLLDKVK